MINDVNRQYHPKNSYEGPEIWIIGQKRLFKKWPAGLFKSLKWKLQVQIDSKKINPKEIL